MVATCVCMQGWPLTVASDFYATATEQGNETVALSLYLLLVGVPGKLMTDSRTLAK